MKKHIASLLLAILISSSCLIFSAAISYDAALDNYSELFSSALSDEDRLAFVSFESLDEDFAESIVSDLEERMINKDIFIVERAGLGKILDEMDFQTSGIVDEESAIRIGSLTGATMIILGKGEHLASSYRVELRMIDLATLAVVRGAIFDLQYDSTIKSLLSDTSNMIGSQSLSISVRAGVGIHSHELSSSLTKGAIYPSNTNISNPLLLGASIVYKTPMFAKFEIGLDIKLKNAFAHPYLEQIDREGHIEFASADCHVLVMANIFSAPFSIDLFCGPVFSKPLGQDMYLNYPIDGGAWGLMAGISNEIPLGIGYMVVKEGFLFDLTYFTADADGIDIELMKRRDAILSIGYSFKLF